MCKRKNILCLFFVGFTEETYSCSSASLKTLNPRMFLKKADLNSVFDAVTFLIYYKVNSRIIANNDKICLIFMI